MNITLRTALALIAILLVILSFFLSGFPFLAVAVLLIALGQFA